MIGRMDMLRHCAVTASSAVRFCSARQSCGLPNCRVDSIGMPLKTFSRCILCYITQVSTFSAQVVSKNIGNFRPLLSFQVFARWNTSFGGRGGDLLRQVILMFSPMWRNFKSPKSSRSGKVESSKDKELLLRQNETTWMGLGFNWSPPIISYYHSHLPIVLEMLKWWWRCVNILKSLKRLFKEPGSDLMERGCLHWPPVSIVFNPLSLSLGSLTISFHIGLWDSLSLSQPFLFP